MILMLLHAFVKEYSINTWILLGSQLCIWDHLVDNLAGRLDMRNGKPVKALEYRTGPAWAFLRARGQGALGDPG